MAHNQQSQSDSMDSIEKYYLGCEDESELAAESSSKAPAGISDGKLIVKLTIPRSDEVIKGGKNIDSTMVVKDHLCSVCSKGFSSGKALGGHMSTAHVQAKKDLSKKLKLSRSSKSGSSSDSGRAKQIPCKICGKTFVSKKSLFGHMRSHPERPWRGMEPPVEIKNTLLPASDPVDEIEKMTSPLLSASDPEQTKKMTSPLLPASDSVQKMSSPLLPASNDVDDDVVDDDESAEVDCPVDSAVPVANARVFDLRQFLISSWKVTGGRGRPGRRPHFVVRSKPPIRSPEYNAGQLIVSLNNGDSSDSSYIQDDEVETMSNNSWRSNSGDRDSRSKRARIEVHPDEDRTNAPVKKQKFRKISLSDHQDIDYPPSDKGNEKALMEPEFPALESPSVNGESEDTRLITGIDDNHSSAYESDSKKADELNNQKYSEGTQSNVTMKNKKRKENVKPGTSEPEGDASPVAEKRDAPTTVTPDKHKCSTCGKSFPSPQALGGHKSSHNKFRVSIINSIDRPSPPHENQANTSISQQLEAKETEGPAVLYQCNICNKTFPSGQALGGHKRCHWAGPLQVASSEEDRPQSVQKFVIFDLNELPEMQDGVNGNSEDAAFPANC